jgi:hypothetical protein
VPLDITPDGRYVLFRSNATDLVTGGSPAGSCQVFQATAGPGRCNLYRWDRLASTGNGISLVSLAAAGSAGNGDAGAGAISDDGAKVAFTSSATDLVPGDTNGVADVFVRDLTANTTSRVSVASGAAGAQALGGGSTSVDISGDGAVVGFTSAAPNLVAGDTNGADDVFVRDIASSSTQRVSVGPSSVGGDGSSASPALSANGQIVAFESVATNLVAGDDNGLSDVFVRDRGAGLTERVNVNDAGQPVDDDESYNPSISADGRFVAFDSFSDQLVSAVSLGGEDTNFDSDVFVRDRLGITERVSLDSGHGETTSFSVQNGHISPDGRYVAFDSQEGDWIGEAADSDNDATDVFLRTRGDATKPGKPTAVAATPGGGSATVTWVPPYHGGSPITSYVVTSAPGGKTCATSGATTCAVSGLTNGTSYTFTVKAFNALGNAASAASSAVVVGTPSAPTGLVATPGDQQVTLAWVASTPNTTPVTGYSVVADPGGQSCSTTTQTTCTIGGLTNGTSYLLTVVATNSYGQSPAATSAPVRPRTVPSAPTNVAAVGGNGQATVTFGAPTSDGGIPIFVYVATATPGGQKCFAGWPGSCTIPNLAGDTPYTITVRAENTAGAGPESSPSNSVTPSVPVGSPSPPTAVSATRGGGQATVTWAAPNSAGATPITSYTVISSPGDKTCTWTSGPLSCTVTGLDDSTAYTFKVRAVNSVGSSTWSAASAPLAPAGVLAGSVRSGGNPVSGMMVIASPTDEPAIVAWTTTAANGGYTMSGVPAGDYKIVVLDPAIFAGSPGYYLPYLYEDAGSTAADFPDATIVTVTGGATTALNPIDLTPNLPGALHAQVTDGNAPIAHMLVALLRADDFEVVTFVLTDANGNATFEDLAPGTYRVVTLDPIGIFGGASRYLPEFYDDAGSTLADFWDSTPVIIAPGGVTALGTIELTPLW